MNSNLVPAYSTKQVDWSIPYKNFSLVVPLWNEEKNILRLVEAIEEANLNSNGMLELILVNNGSTDRTKDLVNQVSASRSWIVPVHLEKNQNYGGGIYEGCKYVTTPVVCYIPGDLQVSAKDVQRVWDNFRSQPKHDQVVVQGVRTLRYDGWQTRIVSRVYTFLANIILGVGVKDVNGLPKMFPLKLLDLLPAERMKTFVFDIQLLTTARTKGWNIVRQPVTFFARREGLSSWSGKRLKVYRESFISLLKIRSLRFEEGVPLEKRR